MIYRAILTLSAAVFLLASCRSGEKKELAEVSQIEFSDSKSLYVIQLTGSYQMNETEEGVLRQMKIVSSSDAESEDYHEIRVAVIARTSEKDADLYAADYESDFIKNCSCTVIEKGSVVFGGAPARHYVVALKAKKWVAYHRHVSRADKIIRIVVSGPADRQNSLKKIFEDTLQHFRFVEKKEKKTEEKKNVSGNLS